ncbi:hypothetical protein HPP92_017264 [Vanilla planifolia]|uniref:Uncharacterized protein n=1 Tax=Vanilla planifolia TaxID=51239 RepID=A0A835QJ49_VANPL|nr:hypothetical protein HPP92_017264 [Vanilla planifolia]
MVANVTITKNSGISLAVAVRLLWCHGGDGGSSSSCQNTYYKPLLPRWQRTLTKILRHSSQLLNVVCAEIS